MMIARLITCFGLLLPLFSWSEEFNVPEKFPTISEAIQAASKGDTIFVAAGRYTEAIQLKDGVRLVSAGDDQPGEMGLKRSERTVIDGTGIEVEGAGVTMAEDAVLDGFTVTGFGSYDEEAWKKSWEVNGNDQPYEHIGHFGIPGIGIRGVSCSVKNSIVHHNGATGIAISGEDGKTCRPLITNNICYRNMGGGIGSMNGSTAIIDDNVCYENFFAGIGHDDANPIVINNECYRNIRAGIGISEGASPMVRGNRCYQNRRAGIGIRSGKTTRPIVEDNECFENAMAGIGVEKEAQPVVVRNHCYRNQLAGLGCRERSKPVLIENRSEENVLSGIGSNSAEPILIGNHCEKNQTAGIGLEGDSRGILIHNQCTGNRLVAVGIPNGGEAILVGNQLSREKGMPPLVAVLGQASLVAVDNSLKGGGVASVMADGDLTFIGNTVKPSGKQAIFLREKATAVFSGNDFGEIESPVAGPGKAVRVESDSQ